MHMDVEYLHECPVIGQKHQKKVKSRRPKPAAAAGAAADVPQVAAPAVPLFPRAQVGYDNFDGPACPEAAAAIEASLLAPFSQEDLALIASIRTELPRHLVNLQVAAWNRLAKHVVTDPSGLQRGLTISTLYFQAFTSACWLKHAEQAEAIRSVCECYPFNIPPAFVVSLQSAIAKRKEAGAAAAGEAAAASAAAAAGAVPAGAAAGAGGGAAPGEGVGGAAHAVQEPAVEEFSADDIADDDAGGGNGASEQGAHRATMHAQVPSSSPAKHLLATRSCASRSAFSSCCSGSGSRGASSSATAASSEGCCT